MMKDESFAAYIKLLRENIADLIEYGHKTGSSSSGILKLQEDLCHEDPFVVFNASQIATIILSDKLLYH